MFTLRSILLTLFVTWLVSLVLPIHWGWKVTTAFIFFVFFFIAALFPPKTPEELRWMEEEDRDVYNY